MKESIPFIIIDRVEAANFKENDKYPVYVYLSNIGKGVARVLVVDLNSSDIRVDIGTPISVGPSGTTHIKIWLPKKDEPKKLLFSVYFWDIDKMCYRTEFNIVLKVTDIPTGGYIASYGSEKEYLTPIGKKEPPEKVLHWPRDSYFEKPWW